ncbi:4Fe-4S dicluster domain-containing protein [Eubacterium sp.]
MENKNVREQILRSYGKNPRKCMSCGKCTATCPSYDNMEYHPHQFVSMVINGKIDALLESESLYTCLSCMACLERCPRGVEPARLIEAVRVAQIRQQGKSHLAAQDIPDKWDEDLPQQAIVSAMRKYWK